jgi:hypothetical protein
MKQFMRKMHSPLQTVPRRQNPSRDDQGSAAHVLVVHYQHGLVRELAILGLHAAHDNGVLDDFVVWNSRNLGLQPC